MVISEDFNALIFFNNSSTESIFSKLMLAAIYQSSAVNPEVSKSSPPLNSEILSLVSSI
jgi:hypothetical protein